MPVARNRRADEKAEYVIVRRIVLGDEEGDDDLDTIPELMATSHRILHSSTVKRQYGPPNFALDRADDDDYDDDDDDVRGPSQFAPTVTVPLAQPTRSTLPNNPSQSAIFQTSTPAPPRRPEGKGGISPTTHHLLIAAGSIGATIILVMTILAVYTMRKRNLTFREAYHHGKAKVTRRGGPPTPPKAHGWDSKISYGGNYGAIEGRSVTPPQRAMSMRRSGSSSSQRPLMALQRSESFTNGPQRSNSPEAPRQQSSFLLDSPPLRRQRSQTHPASETPSSPAVLPFQMQNRNTDSTHNTRSISSASELRYPEPPLDRTLSALPPPPTFKQFLNNRPSVSARAAPGNAMVSRFSWTNSNAPQTPHDTVRDTATQIVGRDSFMTQRSSVPRFRTIDSWVNQQTNRLEEQKLREQYRLTQSSSGTSVLEDPHPSIPEVPEIPESALAKHQIAPVKQNNTTEDESKAIRASALPAPLRIPEATSASSLPGKNVKHERQDTRGTVETAPIFRAHPGTEVRFSTRSAVPSEILDMGRLHNVLS